MDRRLGYITISPKYPIDLFWRGWLLNWEF